VFGDEALQAIFGQSFGRTIQPAAASIVAKTDVSVFELALAHIRKFDP
jgi:hypothetical protein